MTNDIQFKTQNVFYYSADRAIFHIYCFQSVHTKPCLDVCFFILKTYLQAWEHKWIQEDTNIHD